MGVKFTATPKNGLKLEEKIRNFWNLETKTNKKIPVELVRTKIVSMAALYCI